MTNERREGGLLAWQFAHYAENHSLRRNLLVHLATVPLFWAGTLALPAALFVGTWLLPAGLVAMIAAVALQGRGHAMEPVAPLAFQGPLDVMARICVEQWVTFPRFVLSGGLGRALSRPGC